MLRAAVTSSLQVHALKLPDPREAVATALHDTCGTWGPGRERALIVRSFGERAGLGPAPWTLDAAAAALGSGAGYIELGPHRGVRLGRALHRNGWTDLARADAPHMPVQIPGARSRALIPRSWIGRTAVLVAPLVHVGAPRSGTKNRTLRGPIEPFVGPLTGSAAALAVQCGLDGGADQLARWGARILDEVFGQVSVIVDAGWWAALLDGQNEAADLTPTGRVVFLDALPSRGTLFDIDDWLLARLGLGVVPRPRLGIPVVGAAAGGWPRVAFPSPARSSAPGMGTIRALWRPDDGSRRTGRGNSGRRALPRPIPGPLRDAWDRYGAESP